MDEFTPYSAPILKNRKTRRLAENVRQKYTLREQSRISADVIQSSAKLDDNCFIARLPVEILSQILLYSCAEDIFWLYLCGQRLLNYQIRFRAWTEFNARIILPDLESETSICKEWRWPTSLLQQLPLLRSINIHIQHKCRSRERTIPFVISVQDLEKLSISGPIEHFSLTEENVVPYAKIAGSDAIWNALMAHNDLPITRFQLFDFTKSMTRLTSIKWKYHSILLSAQNFKLSSSNMTSLKVTNFRDDFDWTALPTNLTTLKIGKKIDWLNCRQALRGMKSLTNLSVSFGETFNTKDFTLLPNSITKLKLKYYFALEIAGDYSHVPTSLPTSLLHLSVSGMDMIQFQYLPRKLLTLHLRQIYRGCKEARAKDHDEFCQSLRMLPPTLTTFTFATRQLIPNSLRFSDVHIAALPRSLQHLSFDSGCKITEDGIMNLLPPKIDRRPFLDTISVGGKFDESVKKLLFQNAWLLTSHKRPLDVWNK